MTALYAYLAFAGSAGFAVGLLRGIHRSIPFLAGAAVATVALGVIIATYIWASQCWGCGSQGTDLPRSFGFLTTLLLYGSLAGAAVIAISIGAWVQRMLVGRS